MSAAKKSRSRQRPVNLALQGGGAHGAFTWGALDAMLEDGRIDIEAISATSAGAMNAVVLADAMSSGDRDVARERLSAFWQAISDAGQQWNPVRPLHDAFGATIPIEQTPTYWMFDALIRVFSPYQLNPFNFNPLRTVLENHVDFERLRRTKGMDVHLCATNVFLHETIVAAPGRKRRASAGTSGIVRVTFYAAFGCCRILRMRTSE
jgi:NTE family protein